ncbi:MAG: hypothetical protein AAGB31_12090 [Bdellovibrio sp.]
MKSLLTFSAVLLLGVGSQAEPLTSLQEDMAPGSVAAAKTADLIKQYKLVRLWSLDSATQNYTMAINDQVLGPQLINTNVGNSVQALYCPANGKTYAKFNTRGKIVSDESYFLSSLLDTISTPSQDADADKKINPRLTSEVIKKYRSQIQYSSSLVGVNENQGSSQVFSSDYTIGGWFKPSVLDANDSSGKMTLFTKYYSQVNGDLARKEWEIFISGNTIFFHNYRDGRNPVALKYLSADEAQEFRAQNSDLFGIADYRDDVLERQQHQRVTPLIARNYYAEPPQLPAQKSDVNKPVPVPADPIPVPLPPPPPPVTRPVPVPYPPGTIIGGVPEVIKSYTGNYNLKYFWHATTLGSCYNCLPAERYYSHHAVANKHMDVWHYISFSVHLNDPIGPYIDFWIVRDPNPALFGKRADYAQHTKHLRRELDRRQSSFPILNPIQFSHRIEKKCAGSQGSCVKSVLEIGSNEDKRSYSGFMRGIYIAKKAFNETEALEMARAFYPDDNGLCTYQKVPALRQ